MEAGIHADDLLDALGVDEPLAEDVVAATSGVISAVFPALAAQGGDDLERPAADTVVTLAGPGVALAFSFRAGAWTAIDPATVEPGASSAAVGVDDTAALRFALGRLDPDSPRLRVAPDATPFNAGSPARERRHGRAAVPRHRPGLRTRAASG